MDNCNGSDRVPEPGTSQRIANRLSNLRAGVHQNKPTWQGVNISNTSRRMCVEPDSIHGPLLVMPDRTVKIQFRPMAGYKGGVGHAACSSFWFCLCDCSSVLSLAASRPRSPTHHTPYFSLSISSQSLIRDVSERQVPLCCVHRARSRRLCRSR